MPVWLGPQVQEVPRSDGIDRVQGAAPQGAENEMSEYTERLRDLTERLASAKEYL